MRHLALSLRDRPLFADWKVALSAIGIFWAAYLLTLVARSLLIGEFATLFASRLPTILFGMLLTLGIYAVLQLVAARARMRSRAIVAMIASLVAALVQAAFIVSSAPSRESSSQEYRMEAREGAIIIQKGNEIRIQRQSDEAPMVFTLPGVEEMAGRQRLRIAADAAVAWFFFFASFSGVYLALYSAARADSAQRRLAEAEAAAHAAQVRALRYQVNPHFLFNTLNSLSSLVMTERTEQAEEMLIALSEFFRTSLSLDASAGITLEREIQLQQLYLEIEQQRFPDRLDVDIDIPADLLGMQVPALILQPLVENAIKYGVSRTRQPVRLSIAATRPDDGRIAIRVFNDIPAEDRPDRRPPTGTGTGLVNVRERLVAHFGPTASLAAGPADGGFAVTLDFPAWKDVSA